MTRPRINCPAVVADYRDTNLMVKQICAKHRICFRTAMRIIGEAGLKRRGRGGPGRERNHSHSQVLRDYLTTELTIAQLATKHRINEKTVMKHVTRAGAAHRGSGGRMRSIRNRGGDPEHDRRKEELMKRLLATR